ncbi:N-6 DNA methylase [Lentzea roselyniae]|uniref:N-6 DNA methylase n=1 Tax=Lentzea roselyniae TaxID=531940 RepID=A0ABP7C417_9PSEU
MAEDIEVTAAEIARLAGVGRAAVSNWRRRHEDFPSPVGGTDTSPSFRLVDVERWLRDQGKLQEIPLRERIWRQLDAWRGDHRMSELVAAVGVFLHYLRRNGDAVLAEPSDRRLASTLLTAVAESSPDFARFLPTRLEERHIPLLRTLGALVAEGGAESAFAQLSDRFAETHGRQVAATPKELARLMVDLLPIRVSSVLDPACGTGTLLSEAAARADRVFGQEIDSSLVALAAVRASFVGDEVEVRPGDSLRQDAFADFLADAVVCNPPFGVRDWGHDELAYDSRWEYGLPPRSEPELAWIQHCLAHVRPGGSVVALMPPAVTSRRAGRKVRAELVRRGAIRAVVGLPAGIAPPHGISLSIWVLRRPVDPDRSVLFVDVADMPAELAVVRERVLPVVLGFLRDGNEEPTEISRVVATADLLDDEVDLTPVRRVRSVVHLADATDLARTRDSLATLLSGLTDLIPEVVEGPGAHGATTSIGEFVRSGAVTVRQASVRTPTRQGREVLMLLAKDVLGGTGPSGTTVADGLGQDVQLQVGDVVVAVAPRRVAVRVITEAGAVLGPHLQLLRADLERVDPWFLAGFLRGSASHWVSGTAVPRLDVRKVEVPRLSLAEQRRYGAAFRRLDQFEDAMRRTAMLSGDLVQAMMDGLVVGSIDPIG